MAVKEVGEYPEQKTRLLLPRRDEIEQFVENTYSTFLDKIRADPNSIRIHNLKDPSVQISVTYDPKRRGFSSRGHPSYTSLKGRRTNTLFNALSKKAKALERCGFEGTQGIVVCDAGASYLSNTSGGATSFSLRDVVHEFFREPSTVSFVMVVRTVHAGNLSVLGLSRDVFLNRYLRTNVGDTQLIEILCKSVDTLPRTAELAINAYRPARGCFRLFENSHFGGGTMSSSRVKISARTVHALLAGQLAVERFQASYEGPVRIFESALKEGRSLRGVHLEASETEDDDWLTFEFGDPDPAIIPFVNPLRKRTK